MHTYQDRTTLINNKFKIFFKKKVKEDKRNLTILGIS